MNSVPLTSTTPLTHDAVRCLGLFHRFGRHRTGTCLLRSALSAIEDDPGFDLWKGIDELLRLRLVMGFDNGKKFALTLEGADRLHDLLFQALGGETESGATAPGKAEFAA